MVRRWNCTTSFPPIHGVESRCAACRHRAVQVHTCEVAKDKKKHKKSETVVTAPAAAPDSSTKDDGSFAYGICMSCEWRGRARRSRPKARADAKDHENSCKGTHEVKLKTTDHRG